MNFTTMVQYIKQFFWNEATHPKLHNIGRDLGRARIRVFPCNVTLNLRLAHSCADTCAIDGTRGIVFLVIFLSVRICVHGQRRSKQLKLAISF